MLSNSNQSEPSPDQVSVDRRLVTLELLAAIAFLEFAIWTSTPMMRLTSGIVAGLWITRIFFCYARGCVRPPDTSSVYGSTLVVLSVSIAIVVSGIAYVIGIWTPNIETFSQRSLLDWTTVKIPTVILQQVLFQFVFIPTIYLISKNIRTTVVASACLFGFFHIPNPVLVLLTFVIGLLWFSMSVLRPRIVALTLSHLILAVVVANVADEYVLDMRVGEVCFQKWPQRIRGQEDQKSITVYPRVIAGSLGNVVQVEDRIVLDGNVFDKAKNKAPQRVYVVFGSFDADDVIGKSWQAQRILEADNISSDGDFQLEFESPRQDNSIEVRLFVQHEFGWCYPVNDSARMDLTTTDQSGEKVRLYPKEFHGNIGHVKRRAQRTDLIGWGFETEHKTLLDNLLVLVDNRLISLQLERRERKEIADYYSEPALLRCGFVSKIPLVMDSQRPVVYLRNSNGELERMPMELAQKTPSKVASAPKRIR